MGDKARAWIDRGVRLVWIIWPERRTVDVWTPDAAMRTLRDADHLDGGDIVPGFSLPLTTFW
jgi:Uma2 family endonuclease